MTYNDVPRVHIFPNHNRWSENQIENNSRDPLLVTSGGVSGITGYQPTFFELKQLKSIFKLLGKKRESLSSMRGGVSTEKTYIMSYYLLIFLC